MTSKREQALAGLFLCLQNGMSGVAVLRNEPLPTKIPASGLLILRDGDAGEPEITLSPTRYHYAHVAEIEVLVQNATYNLTDNLSLNGFVDVGLLHKGPATYVGDDVNFGLGYEGRTDLYAQVGFKIEYQF